MPVDKQIAPFIGGKPGFTNRLNDVVSPANRLLREFNERRTPISFAQDQEFQVTIVSVESGTGFYGVTLLEFPDGPVDPSSALTEAMIGVEVVTGVLAYNLSEVGGDGTPLNVGAIVWARTTPLISSDGRLVVSILSSGASAGNTTSPKVLSPGSGTTAATDTWSKASDKKAVTIDIQTREVWDGTANILYYFTRLFTFDSIGEIASISAETQHTTDSAVSCT